MARILFASVVAVLLVARPALADDPPIVLDGMYGFAWKGGKSGSSACKKISAKQAAEMKAWNCRWADTASNGRGVGCDSPDKKRGLFALPARAACVDERETQAANGDSGVTQRREHRTGKRSAGNPRAPFDEAGGWRRSREVTAPAPEPTW